MKSKKTMPLNYVSLFTTFASRHEMTYSGFLIHPENGGYSYKLFFREESNRPFEIVGASPKIFKTKRACVVCVKKLKDIFGTGLLTKYIQAVDFSGKKVDIEVKFKKEW